MNLQQFDIDDRLLSETKITILPLQSHNVLNAVNQKINRQKRNNCVIRPDGVEFGTGRRHDKRLTSRVEMFLTVPMK